MNTTERPLLFECEGLRLVGVVTEPVGLTASSDLGLVIVVGGPQVRAGSHRQFVQLARAVAAEGVPTLRFDVRGMGDSEGSLRNFEHLSADIQAAIDALQHAVPAVRRVALWGLCDGASAALLYLEDSKHDPRVQGLVLVNPWVRSEASLAATRVKHYYAQRLLQRDFWGKLLRGQVAGQAVRGLVRSLGLVLQPTQQGAAAGDPATPPFPQRMARAWARFGGSVLLVLSGHDYTAKEFMQAWASADWAAARSHAALHRVDLAEADHTFSAIAQQRLLERHCTQWLETLRQHATVQPARAALHPATKDHAHVLP